MNDIIGYTRVSTEEQAHSGLGLEAQKALIEKEALERGWNIVAWYEDAGISGKDIERRPGLQAAITALDNGAAHGIVTAKIDRLSRSVLDAAQLLDHASKKGWKVLSCDLAIDMSTPMGEALAAMMVVFSQLERRLISQRTKDALAAKRARGEQLGRPSSLPLNVVERIVTAVNNGQSMNSLANELTNEEVPTAQGGKRWYASTIKGVLNSQQAKSLATA